MDNPTPRSRECPHSREKINPAADSGKIATQLKAEYAKELETGSNQ